MVEVQGSPIKKFLIKQFLPIGFVIAVAWALLWPAPGSYIYHIMLGSWKVFSTLHIMIIFFNFGITLETSELKTAFKSWQVLSMGFLMILVGTALTGFVPLAMNFKPAAFGIGMAVFACCPTSLSQGVTVVIQAYGNAALALLLVVLTNLASIIITPLFVKIVLGGMDVSLDAVDLLIKLIVSILVPLVIGKTLREVSKPVQKFVSDYRVPIYMWTNFQVICIVWETLSSSRHQLLAREGGEIFGACLAAILQHMAFLLMATIVIWIASFFFRVKDAERKAFIIMSAQKSLPTAVVIISYMGSPSPSSGGGHHRSSLMRQLLDVGGTNLTAPPPGAGPGWWDYPPPNHEPIDQQIQENALDPGLMAIPCIVFYVLQLFIDTFIATGWASKYEKAGELRAKYAKELDELAKMDLEPGVEGEEGAKGEAGPSAVVASHEAPALPAAAAVGVVTPAPASNEIQAQGLISGPLFSNPLFSPAASNEDERAGLLSSKQ